MGLLGTGIGIGATSVSSLSPPTTGAISFWTRPGTLTGVQRILATSDSFEGRWDDNTLWFDWGIIGTGIMSLTGFTTGTLYHIVCNYNTTTGDAQPFVNGIAYTAVTDRESVAGGTFALFDRVGSGNEYDGKLYDIRIYNRILTLNEIITIYGSRGGDSIFSGLVNRWVLNEGSENSVLSGTGTIKDRGPNPNNISADTSPPQFVYDGPSKTRRRTS